MISKKLPLCIVLKVLFLKKPPAIDFIIIIPYIIPKIIPYQGMSGDDKTVNWTFSSAYVMVQARCEFNSV